MARLSMETGAKFRLLVRRLRLPEPYVRGLLETLWDVVHATGNPVIGGPDSVEAASKWPGDENAWFDALRAGGWIDECAPGTWQIHDYWDHAPDFVIARECKRLGITRVAFIKKVRKSSELFNENPAKSSPPKTRQDKTIKKKRSTSSSLPTSSASESEQPAPVVPVVEAKPPEPEPSRQRKRDDLFDAVAEVGAADPKLNGAMIGKVCRQLREAFPPYTPEEVRKLPAALALHGLDFTITVTSIPKHICRVRAPPAERLPVVKRGLNGRETRSDVIAEADQLIGKMKSHGAICERGTVPRLGEIPCDHV